MEIQKAGDFVDEVIEDIGMGRISIDGATDRLRSRDKAIIERTIEECQHILKCDADALADNGMEQKARGLMRGIFLLPEAREAILRDLS